MSLDSRAGEAGDFTGREALVVNLAQDFSDRRRRGERPTIDEYVAQHPELEAQIRAVFPMLCVLEDLGPDVPGSLTPPRVGGQGPPRQLGEYRIIQEIGRGGMGVVYEAEQLSLKRRVALKVMPLQAFQDEQQLERFHREAQAAARLHHANIVPVFGVGEDGGVHYYVMQFIRGQTLAQLLQQVRRLRAAEGAAAADAAGNREISAATVSGLLVPDGGAAAQHGPASEADPADDSSSTLGTGSRPAYFDRAARIAMQVAEALAYAHNEGVLHRDIKPSNLLMDLKGAVWVTDFGLAKVQGSGELTQSGGLVGTIRYMAPERFRGAGDVRSDVYSLGITLYELLTLRPAFAASDRAEVMRDVMSREPITPRRFDLTIPRDLETIVLKAISKEPGDRYSSAAALADDLRRFINHEPVSARRAGPLERFARWAQRNPALTTATALIALLLVALAAGGFIFAARDRAAFEEAKRRLVEAKLQEGRAWRLSRESGGRGRSLAALSEAVMPSTSSQVRSELIGALALVDLEDSYRRNTSDRVFVDPSLTRFAVARPDGSIAVHRDVACKELIATLPGDGRRVGFVTMGPGGVHLASHCLGKAEDALVLWDLEKTRRVKEARIPSAAFRTAFDAPGKRLAFLNGDSQISILDLPEGREALTFDEIGTPNSLCFAPDGRRLAAAGFGFNQSVVLIFDIESRRVCARLQHPHRAYSVAWHPAGRRIAVACHDSRVHVWDADSATRVMSLEGHSAEVIRVAFSHKGRFLASAGWDNRTLLWEAATGDRLTEAAGGFTAFSQDDGLLGYDQGTQTGDTWRVNGGDCYTTLEVSRIGKGATHMTLAPDGSLLAASTAEGLHLWSLASPGVEARLSIGPVEAVCFQEDGAALWAASAEGLFRWPVSRNAGAGEQSMGPPERVFGGDVGHVSISGDAGRIAALVLKDRKEHVLVLDPAKGAAVLRDWQHPEATRCEISRGGRWVLSTTFQGQDVLVWDVAADSRAHSFDVGTAMACFSPDDRLLAMSWDAWVAVFETGSWKERFRIPRVTADPLGGAVTFTADGKFLAAASSRSLVVLLRVEDGGEVARFEVPMEGLQLKDLSLDASHRFLAASSSTNRVLLWDLRALRLRLRELGLDWNAGEPLAVPLDAPIPKLRIDAGSMAAGELPPGEVKLRKNRALDAQSRRVELDPDADAFRARAIAFAKAGDWGSAVADLDHLLAAAPDDVELLARRAAAHASLSHVEEADRDLDRAMALVRARRALAETESTKLALVDALRLQGRRQLGIVAMLSSARAAWKEVLDLLPGDAEAIEDLVWMWAIERCMASPGEAAQPLDEDARLVLQLAQKNYGALPDNAMQARNLGAVLYHFDRLDEARPLLERAARLSQELVSTQVYLAMIEHRRGDAAKARDLLAAVAAAARKRFASKTPGRQVLELYLGYAERTLAKPPDRESKATGTQGEPGKAR